MGGVIVYFTCKKTSLEGSVTYLPKVTHTCVSVEYGWKAGAWWQFGFGTVKAPAGQAVSTKNKLLCPASHCVIGGLRTS